jgi:hypothetical protein
MPSKRRSRSLQPLRSPGRRRRLRHTPNLHRLNVWSASTAPDLRRTQAVQRAAHVSEAPQTLRGAHAYALWAKEQRAQDNIANLLNAQELARVGGGPAPGMGGPYGGGYGQPSPRQSGGYGDRLMAPGTLSGGYGQPAPTQGIPGGNQPSASSHPPY